MARLARALVTLRAQVDQAHPGRAKFNDGWIGDTAHQARKSDHNPNAAGVVQAIDLSHDPAHGFDSYDFADMLRQKRDLRIKYVISHGRIFSSAVTPWEWRPYVGLDSHDHHVHISASDDPQRYDDGSLWDIDASTVEPPVNKPNLPPAPPAAPPPTGRMESITATVFGGPGDFNRSAYDGHVIGLSELGVALPARITGPLPTVRVFQGDKSVVCKIVDVGPWNTDDPYWKTGARPQSETGTDRRGRHTNHAGIDLTPAAAKALGINGKGIVDWEFIA